VPYQTIVTIRRGGGAAMITVVVVSGIRLYREGLAQALERAEGITVLGAAADGPAATSCVIAHRPDVAVLDMATPDSASTLQSIGNIASGMKVVAIAVGETEPEILASVEAGAAGYVLREASLSDLLLVIQTVVRGETVCSPRIAASLMRRLADIAAEGRPLDAPHRLTKRENQIISLVAMGMTNKEIARRLRIQLPTVKNHVHNILEKLQLHRRGQVPALLGRWGVAEQGLRAGGPD
jgi:DNA-binding NarL/FixJ family response regulator